MSEQPYTAADIKVVDNTSYRPTLRADYVLLGMVSDYLGRSADFNDEVAEWFFPTERVVANIFAKYARDALALGDVSQLDLRTTETGHIQVVSQSLKKHIDALYSSPKAGTPWEGRTSMELHPGAFPTITSRQYRSEEMDPRFSYLYGAYLRYGSDEPFQYRLANSVDRVEFIKQFAVELNARWVSHKFTVNTAPIGNEISFEPDPILGTLLRAALAERAAAIAEFDK